MNDPAASSGVSSSLPDRHSVLDTESRDLLDTGFRRYDEFAASCGEWTPSDSKTELITHSDLSSDLRTPKIGIIKGTVTFIDGSKLFFTEYVDARFKPQKLSYSFQYQDKDDELIFRYDNASHKPKLAFTEHKHLKDGSVVEAGTPDLSDILQEVINAFL